MLSALYASYNSYNNLMSLVLFFSSIYRQDMVQGRADTVSWPFKSSHHLAELKEY